MFSPKKRIPKLTVVAFALGGCGGGGGDAGGLEGALKKFCMNVDRCYAGTTTQDCMEIFYHDYLPYIYVDADCEAAMISYLDCGATLSCIEMRASTNRCDRLFDAAVDACEPVP
jgi:hypothetical protein